MNRSDWPMIVGAVLAATLMGSLLCTNKAPARSAELSSSRPFSPEQDDVRQRIAQIIADGLVRPFGPSGPKFMFEDSLYQVVRSHPSEALELLRAQLRSSNALVRCNAYDLLAEVCTVEGSRSEARLLLAKGLEDQSSMIRMFVKGRSEQLRLDIGEPPSLESRPASVGPD